MRQSETKGKMLKKNKNYFDYSLLFIIIFLLCFGLVMLYSTSSYNAQLKTGSSTFYLYKQIQSTILGIIVMGAVALFDYHRLPSLAIIGYPFSILLVALVLTPLGVEYNGARRWISIGVQFQPAEIVKIVLIVFMAYIISKSGKKIKSFKTLVKLFILVIIPVVCIAIFTKNLSSAIIIAGIGVVMLFVASPKYLQFVIVGGVGVAGISAFIYAERFRMGRIMAWLNPEVYSQEGGYQILQALYAIGSGGLFGKGLGQSVQKLGFVPEAQNDMIFTIICEELGLFGGMAVILLFLFMIWRFMIIASNAPDLFGSLIVVGVMAHIAIQVILNIAVVTNSIPNTGVTLPFISYGGTSVVFLLAEMGIVLSVSRNIKQAD